MESNNPLMSDPNSFFSLYPSIDFVKGEQDMTPQLNRTHYGEILKEFDTAVANIPEAEISNFFKRSTPLVPNRLDNNAGFEVYASNSDITATSIVTRRSRDELLFTAKPETGFSSEKYFLIWRGITIHDCNSVVLFCPIIAEVYYQIPDRIKKSNEHIYYTTVLDPKCFYNDLHHRGWTYVWLKALE